MSDETGESDDGEGAAVVLSQDNAGQRLDKTLCILYPEFSRSRLQALIGTGNVQVNGQVCEQVSCKLKAGDVIELDVPDLVEAMPQPEDIALDIVYEDEDLLVINKPAGLVVHPGAGNPSGTLVNALLHHCAQSLSGIGGVLRPGIVHRLDKETSGLMVVAKNDIAHRGLAAQLEERTLKRVYWAVTLKVPVPLKGVVDRPIGRDPRNRLKMSTRGSASRHARTHYHVLESFGDSFALVECTLDTGRTHQIRVHMESLKHPVIGDPLYGPQRTGVLSALNKLGLEASAQQAVLNFSRQALHAKALSFFHPVTEEEMAFEADLPEDFYNLLILLGNYKDT